MKQKSASLSMVYVQRPWTWLQRITSNPTVWLSRLVVCSSLTLQSDLSVPLLTTQKAKDGTPLRSCPTWMMRITALSSCSSCPGLATWELEQVWQLLLQHHLPRIPGPSMWFKCLERLPSLHTTGHRPTLLWSRREQASLGLGLLLRRASLALFNPSPNHECKFHECLMKQLQCPSPEGGCKGLEPVLGTRSKAHSYANQNQNLGVSKVQNLVSGCLRSYLMFQMSPVRTREGFWHEMFREGSFTGTVYAKRFKYNITNCSCRIVVRVGSNGWSD